MRKTSHTVFSSSWTRREQAEKLDEWQELAGISRQIAANRMPAPLARHKMRGISNEIITLLVWSK